MRLGQLLECQRRVALACVMVDRRCGRIILQLLIVQRLGGLVFRSRLQHNLDVALRLPTCQEQWIVRHHVDVFWTALVQHALNRALAIVGAQKDGLARREIAHVEDGLHALWLRVPKAALARTATVIVCVLVHVQLVDNLVERMATWWHCCAHQVGEVRKRRPRQPHENVHMEATPPPLLFDAQPVVLHGALAAKDTLVAPQVLHNLAQPSVEDDGTVARVLPVAAAAVALDHFHHFGPIRIERHRHKHGCLALSVGPNRKECTLLVLEVRRGARNRRRQPRKALEKVVGFANRWRLALFCPPVHTACVGVCSDDHLGEFPIQNSKDEFGAIAEAVVVIQKRPLGKLPDCPTPRLVGLGKAPTRPRKQPRKQFLQPIRVLHRRKVHLVILECLRGLWILRQNANVHRHAAV